MKESVVDNLGLETMEDDQTFVLKDGSLMTMIRLDGAIRDLDVPEFVEFAEKMRTVLSSYMSQPGHAIEVNFLRDPKAAEVFLERQVNRSRRNARAAGMSLDDVLNERVTNLSRFMVAESCVICIYTRSSCLSAEERKQDQKKASERLKMFPPIVGAQIPRKALQTVHSRHAAFAEAIHTAFENNKMISGIMSVKEGLQEIRAALYPETYPIKTEWSPRMPSWSADAIKEKKNRRPMAPETPDQVGGNDYSPFGVPSFDLQIATEDAEIETNRTVRIGDTIFQAFDMTMAPEVLPDFNALVNDITAKGTGTPWRASFRVESGGVSAQSMKRIFLAIFTWAAPTYNRRIKEALDANIEIDGADDTIVRFRMSFVTWAPAGKDEALRKHAQILSGAVRRWGGNCGVDGLSGDPLMTALSALPGATPGSTAPVVSPPLRDAISMLPFTRQASPWENGAVLLRTRSGKIWPYQPISSKQDTWITLFVGTPGSGKSVAMNAFNFATAISPNTAGGSDAVLPRISIQDYGRSSEGMISLIQESLPANRRHEALFKKLKMDREFAMNPMDTLLGMRKPLIVDRDFLINFLEIVCGDGVNPPSGPMRGLISAAIDRAYEEKMDHRNPAPYIRGDHPKVDRALDELGFDGHGGTIWWEVVDFLFEHNRRHEAEIAQRRAVPILSDLVTAASEPQVKLQYNFTDPDTGQNLVDSFNRIISEVTRDYAILSTYTRFSIGSARIVSLDLQDVSGRGPGASATKQTAMMFMLARKVSTRDFFVDPEEIELSVQRNILPDFYLSYHLEVARQNKEIPKVICMDEFHRTGNLEAIINQVIQDAREGRKFNVDIKIASQFPEDFPPAIFAAATGFVVCRADSGVSLETISKSYDLSEAEKDIIRNRLTGPGSRGAPMWIVFKTKDHGQIRQELLLTLGPAELWAFSTTNDDVALRSRLYKELGAPLARRVLAARFPGGSAKSEIEKRITLAEEIGERVDDDAISDIVGSLSKELVEMAIIMQSKSLV